MSETAKAKKQLTPTQECFNLWGRGFFYAAVIILLIVNVLYIISYLYLGYTFGLPFDETLREQKAWFVFLTLIRGAAISYVFVLPILVLLAIIRYTFRTSVLGPFFILIVFFTYLWAYERVEAWFVRQSTTRQGWIWVCVGIVGFLCFLIGTGWETKHTRDSKISDRRVSIRGLYAWIKSVPDLLRDWISGRWALESVRKIYDSNNDSSSVNGANTPLANITNDFKAWTDATKLLLTIMTGLTTVLVLFSEDATMQTALKTIGNIFLLVPALCCVYMEIFRRQCERQWETLQGKKPEARLDDTNQKVEPAKAKAHAAN